MHNMCTCAWFNNVDPQVLGRNRAKKISNKCDHALQNEHPGSLTCYFVSVLCKRKRYKYKFIPLNKYCMHNVHLRFECRLYIFHNDCTFLWAIMSAIV
uniref:Uncharacterized protein n=1 Tax=Arundo donax TaxID=35708 RepID=A0A0A8XUV6_ARUDO